MEDCKEKIICYDKGNDLATAMLANCCNKDNGMNPALTAMMANGGMGNQWNNPFIYLVWMMFAQRMWGNDWNNHYNDPNYGYQALSNQIGSFQTRMQDNHNTDLLFSQTQNNNQEIRAGVDKITSGQALLQQVLCGVKSAIEQVGGQVGFSAERVINAVNMGDCNVIQAIKDCCCTTQKSILEMGYQNQLQNCKQTNDIMTGINGVNTGVERGFSNLGNIVNQGFSQLGYQANTDKCDIINAINSAQQRTSDLLNGHWQSETERKLQDAKFEISQLKQNQYLAGLINGNGCCCNSNNTCC